MDEVEARGKRAGCADCPAGLRALLYALFGDAARFIFVRRRTSVPKTPRRARRRRPPGPSAPARKACITGVRSPCPKIADASVFPPPLRAYQVSERSILTAA